MKTILLILLLATTIQAQFLTLLNEEDDGITLYVNDYDIGVLAQGTTHDDSLKMWTTKGEVILDSIYTSSVSATLYQDTVTVDSLTLYFTVDVSTSGSFQDTVIILSNASNPTKTIYVNYSVPGEYALYDSEGDGLLASDGEILYAKQ